MSFVGQKRYGERLVNPEKIILETLAIQLPNCERCGMPRENTYHNNPNPIYEWYICEASHNGPCGYPCLSGLPAYVGDCRFHLEHNCYWCKQDKTCPTCKQPVDNTDLIMCEICGLYYCSKCSCDKTLHRDRR